MTSLPTWVFIVLTLSSPVIAFIGVLISQVFSSEKRAKREQAMLHLRWAGELAISHDMSSARLGIAQLATLTNGKFLDPSWAYLVREAFECVVAPAAEKIQSGIAAYEDLNIIQEAA